VFIQVPYSEIQFVKTTTGFESKYNLTVSVFDEDKDNRVGEKSWSEKITAKEFDQTISKTNYNLSLRSFNLEPGKYVMRTSFEDVDSRKEYAAENVITVRKLEQEFAMSDMMLISKQTVVEGSNKIIPNVSRNVAAKKDGIPFFFEVYSSIPREIKIEYSVLDNGKEKFYKEEITKQIDSGRTQIFHNIKDVDLGLGNYVLTADVKDDKNDLAVSTIKNFVSRWMGVPSSIRDLDKAVAQMVYIATSSELDEINNAKSKEEKIQKYLAYWKKKDPDPQSEDNPVFDEYYRRVVFANENFSHYIEGWRTDRGMVFIILGAPNNIDRHPFEYDSKPYEVWEYYELNKSFVFLDETGFGDYRLITPLYGDFFRYRN
jgi:GWxTD domain-containing protein